jgi:hypothetical protein
LNNKLFYSIAVFLIMMSSTVYAQNFSVGLKASTLGAGIEAETSFSDTFGGRVGINYFEYDFNGTKDDIDYDFDVTLLSVSALLDWHPFKGSFRVSGGVMYNGNDIDADARSSATYEIGNTTYQASQVGNLTGDIDFNDVAPYAGIGWDTSFGKSGRFGLLVDLGVMYQGSPEVDFTANGPISASQAFQNDLASEEENLQNDIDEYEYYPVVSIGFAYRF